MCRISIITVTYNRSYFLLRTIESVLSQSFKDFEYIIINNGSTDDTLSVINKYRDIDKRIRVITKTYNDLSNTFFYFVREELLMDRNAPYYMWIDDDDYMESNTVETLFHLIKHFNADIATVGSVFVYPDGSKKNKFVFDETHFYSRIDAMRELLKREKFNSAQGGKLYKKSLLEYVTLPNTEQVRDIHKEYRILNNVRNNIVVTGKPLYYFYRHTNNKSGLDTPEQITPERMCQHLEANKVRTEWLAENMPEIKDYAFYSELSFMVSLYERIHRLDIQPCFDIAQGMKDTLLQNLAFLSGHSFCTESEKEILKSMH